MLVELDNKTRQSIIEDWNNGLFMQKLEQKYKIPKSQLYNILLTAKRRD